MFTSNLIEKNYMQTEIESLKQAIQEVSGKDWELQNFRYEPENCNTNKTEHSGPGIAARLVSINLNKPKKAVDIYYPLYEYKNLNEFIDSLNADVAVMNIMRNYPSLGIAGSSFFSKTLTIYSPGNWKPIELKILDKCYDPVTCCFDTAEYLKSAKDYLNAPTSVTRGGFMGTPNNFNDIPKIIEPPFFIDIKKLHPMK